MLDIIGVQLLDDTLHDGFGSKCSTEKKKTEWTLCISINLNLSD